MSIEVPIIILIISVPTFFLSKYIFKILNFGDDRNRKIIAIVPTIILSPLIYVGMFYLWIFSVSYYPKNDFNKHKWETNTEKRYEMSNDIIESKMLIGKGKEEITEILGQDFYSYTENHIAYELGFVPNLFNIDPDVLDIYFENDKVIRVEQHRT